MICRDPGVVEQVQGAAAALQASVEVTREVEQVRRRWRSASAVFVGADSAAWVAGLALPTRPGVHVVGREAADVLPWSVPLEASVLLLPEQVGMVGAVLDGSGSVADGIVLRCLGASGGLGTSTLAAGLALVAGKQGSAAVVELAQAGGGLDLLLGLEREPGWRWDELLGARGHLGDLLPRLPHQGGVPVVSLGRAGGEPGSEAATAVVRALQREVGHVVLDAGRGENVVAEHWGRTRTILLVGADVRGVLAARSLLEQRSWPEVELVVRRGPGRTLAAQEVAEALGLPLLGCVGHHRALPGALAAGVAPTAASARFTRECRQVLTALAQLPGATP